MWSGVGQAAVIAAPVTIAGNTDLSIQTRNEEYMFTPIAAGDYTIEVRCQGRHNAAAAASCESLSLSAYATKSTAVRMLASRVLGAG